MEKKKDCPNKLLTTLMIVCVVLSVVILGIVSYDKFIKKEEKRDVAPFVPAPMENNNKEITGNGQGDGTGCMPTSYNGEKVSSVKKIDLSDVNQKVTIGSKTLNLKVDKDDALYINNNVANSYKYDANHVTLVPPVAYLTDKYVFFTSVGQDWDGIVYAIDENAKEIVVNDNGYQMHDFRIEDGYLHATGHVFLGLVDDNPDKDLLIKYIDNTLIVTEAK